MKPSTQREIPLPRTETGILDRLNNMIKEGDVVDAPGIEDGCKALVFWNKTFWALRTKEGGYTGLPKYQGLKPTVLGSIYENPDLLTT